MLERLFSTYQIADLLGTSEGTVVDWIRKGWLPVRDMPGRQVRISEKGLVQFLKDRGIDMEAIMVSVASDEDGKQLSEPLRTEEPLAVPPEEQPSPPPEEPPRKGRPQGTLTPPEDMVLPEEPTPLPPDAVEEEQIEQRESYPVDPAVQVVEAVLMDAVVRRVSRIHLDSCRDGLSLRVRIDGVLHDKPNFRSRLPKGLGPRLIAHFKALAGLEVAGVARPQNGCFRYDINGRELDFRLATCPTVHGERLVIHVPERAEDALAMDGIGLGEDDLSLLRSLLSERCGLILVAGLPGSGRATTLRAMLAEVNTPGRDIVALESRSEFHLKGVSRCRVDREKGFAVADALRALRNQNVDVILADDITERSAAAGAIEAAIDGRLVLAGVFARNSAVAMEMMLESAQPWALASALLTVINLRTVRKICPKCRQEVKPPADLSLDFPVYRGAGCDECSQTGYAGVTGLFSLLHVDGIVASILRNNDNAGQIISAAERAGMDTLRQAGLEKVRDGITSLEELSRALPIQ